MSCHIVQLICSSNGREAISFLFYAIIITIISGN